MSEAVIPVHLSGSLLQGAADQAARSGISLEDWLRSLAEERIRDAYVTEKYFSRKRQPGDGAELLAILDSTNDHPPLPGDELEG
jgi:hypothetical protein